jgi:hypothetical protein
VSAKRIWKRWSERGRWFERVKRERERKERKRERESEKERKL